MMNKPAGVFFFPKMKLMALDRMNNDNNRNLSRDRIGNVKIRQQRLMASDRVFRDASSAFATLRF